MGRTRSETLPSTGIHRQCSRGLSARLSVFSHSATLPESERKRRQFSGVSSPRITTASRPNLTLNVGLRWEINPFYYGIRGPRKAGFDASNGRVIVPSNMDPTVQPLTQALPATIRRPHRNQQFGRVTGHHSAHYQRTGAAHRLRLASFRLLQLGDPLRLWHLLGNSRTNNLINNSVGTVPFIASQTVINDPAGSTAPSRTFGNFFLGQPVTSPNTFRAGFVRSDMLPLRVPRPMSTAKILKQRTPMFSSGIFAVQRQLTANTFASTSPTWETSLRI